MFVDDPGASVRRYDLKRFQKLDDTSLIVLAQPFKTGSRIVGLAEVVLDRLPESSELSMMEEIRLFPDVPEAPGEESRVAGEERIRSRCRVHVEWLHVGISMPGRDVVNFHVGVGRDFDATPGYLQARLRKVAPIQIY